MLRDVLQHPRFLLAACATGLLVLLGIAVELQWVNLLAFEAKLDFKEAKALVPPIRFGMAFVPVLVAALWVRWTWRSSDRVKGFAYSVAILLCWLGALFAASEDRFRPFREPLLTYGQCVLFFIGLGWVVWFVEVASRHFESKRDDIDSFGLHVIRPRDRRLNWNPLDPAAWYYGRENKRLNQSLALLSSYVVFFFVACVWFAALRGGSKDSYELPGGGGGGGGGGKSEQASIVQQVQLKKVTRRKLVINPYSSILFNAPPIDEVKLALPQATEHLYSAGQGKGAGSGSGSGIGYGDGDGSGFGPGTSQGKVRFIRLEYAGGDWNQDMSFFSGENMLREYGIRTQQKVSEKEEVRSIAQLKGFPAEKSPPFVYLTGEKSISISASEAKILKEYMLDKHGMLFIDNGGSAHFHNQVLAMMQQVLPNVRPTPVPLDDIIHRVPFAIPYFPYVAPHGGKEALGWRVDGRLVAYYHPGDIGDAWADDHAGVKREIYDACYQLGVNVIFYAHVEYSKWLMSRAKK